MDVGEHAALRDDDVPEEAVQLLVVADRDCGRVKFPTGRKGDARWRWRGMMRDFLLSLREGSERVSVWRGAGSP